MKKFFGQTVYRPPWQKIARTPMTGTDKLVVLYPNQIIKYVKILQASEAEITFHYSLFPLNI